MKDHRWNWSLWAGFLLSLVAFLSYFVLFVRFPLTRDVPWLNYLLFGLATFLLAIALKRAFGQPQTYRGKIVGPILTALSVAVTVLFCFFIFHFTKQLPKSAGAPRIGVKAPDFELSDTQGKMVSLSGLLTTPNPPRICRQKVFC